MGGWILLLLLTSIFDHICRSTGGSNFHASETRCINLKLFDADLVSFQGLLLQTNEQVNFESLMSAIKLTWWLNCRLKYGFKLFWMIMTLHHHQTSCHQNWHLLETIHLSQLWPVQQCIQFQWSGDKLVTFDLVDHTIVTPINRCLIPNQTLIICSFQATCTFC